MDQEEALKLLRGGRDGVKEWNARRDKDEAIPSLQESDLSGADLRGTYLFGANLSGAYLSNIKLHEAHIWGTVIDTNLSKCQGLDEVKHYAPSTIGIPAMPLIQGRSAREVPPRLRRSRA